MRAHLPRRDWSGFFHWFHLVALKHHYFLSFVQMSKAQSLTSLGGFVHFPITAHLEVLVCEDHWQSEARYWNTERRLWNRNIFMNCYGNFYLFIEAFLKTFKFLCSSSVRKFNALYIKKQGALQV